MKHEVVMYIFMTKPYFFEKQTISRKNLNRANATSAPFAHTTPLLCCTMAAMVAIIWVLL